MRLKVDKITVKLGSSEILKDLTIEAKKGDFIALLGPNGSGKSTLLRTIFGIIKPLKGVVFFDGKEEEKGYLPQETADTNLRVIEVVLLGRTPYLGRIKSPKEKDFEIAMDALRSVGMENFADRKFSELSGGEKQKVLLARLFAQEPKILLLDEPTAHLDISAQLEIMRIIKELAGDRIVIVALHDINLAISFANCILMIKDGRIAYAGSPRNVITEESIKEVFGVEVSVKRHGQIYVIPKIKSSINGRRVHVICGGGSGKELLHLLSTEGYSVSAGVLNALDSDWEIVSEIGGMIVDAPPFSEISEDAHQRNLEAIKNSEAVILADLSIGRGNLKNLISAKYASELGKLIVVDKTPFEERNFVGQEAEKIYSEILKNATVVKSEGDALNALRKLLSR
ncbi:MAG: cobalamin transport system ATP-binding protein [Archaeoglobaceae archaeon]|nr:cobalamin transport system ATP-binding protein [Archaeoglobaceae archaeon]MDK2876567.1 cobalamin transport system ATP-binding protein [Archaeoglobaceae archaeon]